MGKTHFRKGGWSFDNHHERFKHFCHARDKKALRELRHLQKKELGYPPSILCKDNVGLDRIVSNRKGEQFSAKPEIKTKFADESSADSKPDLNISHDEKRASRPPRKRMTERVQDALALRFRKELAIAETKRREKESAVAEKDEQIKAREIAIKRSRQARRTETRLFCQKTKKGQPKMASVISALTSKILKASTK